MGIVANEGDWDADGTTKVVRDHRGCMTGRGVDSTVLSDRQLFFWGPCLTCLASLLVCAPWLQGVKPERTMTTLHLIVIGFFWTSGGSVLSLAAQPSLYNVTHLPHWETLAPQP